MTLRRAVLMVLLAGAAITCGCATPNTSSDDKVSTIPWNRPQSWEGTGSLGGMRTPGSSGY